MDASNFIERIRAAGFKVKADGDKLIVHPAEKLTAPQKEFIRKHKPAILDALARANAPHASLADHAHAEFVRGRILSGWAWHEGAWIAPEVGHA